VVKVANDFNWSLIPGVGDSKQLSKIKRQEIFKRAIQLKRAGIIDYTVTLVSAKEIDTKGIVFAINKALTTSLEKVCPQDALKDGVVVKLDGGLKAPIEYKNQETIIKGDDRELVIGLASIIAKVIRDQHMETLDKKYPGYGLAQHKGYGTVLHRSSIAVLGLSKIHRASYCQNIKIKL
jgi:ribonuclease HII